MSQVIALYARVSSSKQARDNTIESQLERLREYIQEHGLVLDEDLVFVDDGVSGTTFERLALDRLRDKAVSGHLDAILVLSPDRLARKHAHQLLLIEEFHRLGVEIIFANRKIGSTPEDQLLLQIQGVIAEYEREMIMERSRRGKLHKARQDDVSVLSGAPYGYIYVPKTETGPARYEINPVEARVVKRIYRSLVHGKLSMQAIVRRLNADQIPARRGRSWSRSTVYQILQNPAYTGKAAYRKRQRVKRQRPTKVTLDQQQGYSKQAKSSAKTRSRDDWIFITVPAIVDLEIFEQVQIQLQENKRFARRNTRHGYLLSGLLRCQECGYAMYGLTKSRSKSDLSYYRCRGQDRRRFPGKECKCSSHPIRTEVLDDLVWEEAQRLLQHPELVLQEYLERASRGQETRAARQALLVKTRKSITRLENQKERLLDLYQAGVIDLSVIKSRLESIRRAIKQFEAECRVLDQKRQYESRHRQAIDQFKEFSKQLELNLANLSFDQKQALIRLLLTDIAVDFHSQLITIKHTVPLADRRYALRPPRPLGKVLELL